MALARTTSSAGACPPTRANRMPAPYWLKRPPSGSVPDCGPRTQIACNAITANECRRQRVDGSAGYGLPLRHARPSEVTCRYEITASQEHIRGATAPLPGTSRCEESVNRVFSALHMADYRPLFTCGQWSWGGGVLGSWSRGLSVRSGWRPGRGPRWRPGRRRPGAV